MIRLVAIDIDDTLLRKDLSISPQVQEAIKQAQQQGVKVTLCSGRMYQSARPIAAGLEMDLPIITYQGAMIRYSLSKATICHETINRHVAADILQLAEQYDVHINYYINDNLYLTDYTSAAEYYVRMVRTPAFLVENWRQVSDFSPTKILLIGDPSYMDKIQSTFLERFGDQVFITKSKPKFLEFTNLQANKGRALEILANHFGIGIEQTMAIGDSYNDIEMIKRAGIGVAMGNAPEAVKKYAEFITLTNEEDGVAEALKRFVL